MYIYIYIYICLCRTSFVSESDYNLPEYGQDKAGMARYASNTLCLYSVYSRNPIIRHFTTQQAANPSTRII